MQVPEKLGKKNEDPDLLIRITMDKLSVKLDSETEAIFDWLEKEDPIKYKHLVTDCFLEKNWAREHSFEQLKKDLHEFYREWLKVKIQYENRGRT